MCSYDSTFKIVVLAIEKVGKKTLVNKYLATVILENYKSDPYEPNRTLGVDFFSKGVTIHGNRRIIFQTWIYSDEERFRFLFNSYIRGSNGFVLMYDITNAKSLNGVSKWCQMIKNEIEYDIPILLVGNKLDLENCRNVSKQQVEKFKENHDISSSIEISLKTGENVEKLFMKLTELILKEEINEEDFRLEPKRIIEYNLPIYKSPFTLSESIKIIFLLIGAIIFICFVPILLFFLTR